MTVLLNQRVGDCHADWHPQVREWNGRACFIPVRIESHPYGKKQRMDALSDVVNVVISNTTTLTTPGQTATPKIVAFTSALLIQEVPGAVDLTTVGVGLILVDLP